MHSTSIDEPADAGASPPRAEEAFRTRLHRMWAEVAEGWGEHAESVDARSARVTERLLTLSAPGPGERVLELACGAGGAGLAAARLVAPDGEVVLSDVAAEMTAIAVARATARGLVNVTTRVLDLEQINEPDCSFDVVLCREGLMLVPDPARAAREIRRVLRPGGRVAVAVWGPRHRNPWLSVMFDAVSAELGRPAPPPGIPGPFSLQDPERLAALLTDAALQDVAVSELPVPLNAPSFDAWWTARVALAGPLTQILAGLGDGAVQAIRERAREAAAPYESTRGLQFPGIALLAGGRRA